MAATGAVSTETTNELMVVFSDTITAGFDGVSGAVSGIFGLMIVLVVALTGIQWTLSPNRDVLAGGFGKILLIGAFAWLINDWQALSETIYDGFIEIGLLAGGGSIGRDEFLNPGAIIEQGWTIAKALAETPAAEGNALDVMGNLMDALILAVAVLGIMLSFAVLGLQIIVALIEFKIVTLGSLVLLPFGIWSKSSFLAERPLGYVVSSGLKVLALAVVVSGARTVFDQLIPSENPDIYEALTILVAALLLAMLAMFIPNLAAALVTGGPALGAGAAMTGGLAVGGAAALAGGGLVKAGGAVIGGGRNSERASRISSSSRAAAGAGTGRSAPSSPTPGGSGPSPSSPSSGGVPTASNDNPSPTPSRSGSGAGPATRPAASSGAPAANDAGGTGGTGTPIVEGGKKAGKGSSTAAAAGSTPLVDEMGRRRAKQARTAARATGTDGLPLFTAAGAGASQTSATTTRSGATSASTPPTAGPAPYRVGGGDRSPEPAPSPGTGSPNTGSPSDGSGATMPGDTPLPRRDRDGKAENDRRKQAKAARRSGAMQTFFVANAARNLLPSDSVGAATPSLRSEDT